MSKKFQWNPLTDALEDINHPSPHISSADAKKNDPTAGAKYVDWWDRNAEIKNPTKVQKLTDDLEKVKKTNEVLMKYGKPDKKFLENLEPVKFEADIGFVGQMSGKKIDGMKEAVKMNDFVDVTDKAKQGGMTKTVKTNFGEVKTPGQPETKPEVKAGGSQIVQMLNDMEYLAKQRLESQILEHKFNEIMKPQRDPDMDLGIASVDGVEVFKKTVDLAKSKWRPR